MLINSSRYSGFGAISPPLLPTYRQVIWDLGAAEHKAEAQMLEADLSALTKRLKEIAASDPMAAQFKSAVRNYQAALGPAVQQMEYTAHDDQSFIIISAGMSGTRAGAFKAAKEAYLDVLRQGNLKLHALFDKWDAAQETADAAMPTTTRAGGSRISPATLDLTGSEALMPAPEPTNWLLIGGGVAGGLLLLGVGGFFAFRKKAPKMAGYHGRRSCGGLRGCK